MNRPVKCFIVEGKVRDYSFTKRMIDTFFKGRFNAVTVCLPAEQNIYMLYNTLKEDAFETDIIEILREKIDMVENALSGISRTDIDEVYLFFDFDHHQNNLPSRYSKRDVLEEMLECFDNETDNGKLYVSYPMVEAFYDYRSGYCEPFSTCWYPINRFSNYKHSSGDENPKAGNHILDYESWREIISIYALRIQCFFGLEELDFSIYRDYVSPKEIYHRQRQSIHKNSSVFVLSAFPEFLLDYFPDSFWRSNVRLRKYHFDYCAK